MLNFLRASFWFQMILLFILFYPVLKFCFVFVGPWEEKTSKKLFFFQLPKNYSGWAEEAQWLSESKKIKIKLHLNVWEGTEYMKVIVYCAARMCTNLRAGFFYTACVFTDLHHIFYDWSPSWKAVPLLLGTIPSGGFAREKTRLKNKQTNASQKARINLHRK